MSGPWWEDVGPVAQMRPCLAKSMAQNIWTSVGSTSREPTAASKKLGSGVYKLHFTDGSCLRIDAWDFDPAEGR